MWLSITPTLIGSMHACNARTGNSTAAPSSVHPASTEVREAKDRFTTHSPLAHERELFKRLAVTSAPSNKSVSDRQREASSKHSCVVYIPCPTAPPSCLATSDPREQSLCHSQPGRSTSQSPFFQVSSLLKKISVRLVVHCCKTERECGGGLDEHQPRGAEPQCRQHGACSTRAYR